MHPLWDRNPRLRPGIWHKVTCPGQLCPLPVISTQRVNSTNEPSRQAWTESMNHARGECWPDSRTPNRGNENVLLQGVLGEDRHIVSGTHYAVCPSLSLA